MIITTYETCPNCRYERAKVRHGITDERNRFVHNETCPECGEHWPIVCYDCEHCNKALSAHRSGDGEAKGK